MALPLIADLLLPSEIANQVGTENVVSAVAAACAMRLLNQHAGVTQGPTGIERKLNAILGVGA